ncbi:hypothetical protein SAMN05443377_101166 [Propionibacterium cyclohexanicum]|uniref:YlxR domain-containing protein n=1 Tax=Propionibacterium cyclohexanicum TaxID=64702 RepID=A0A1H9PPM8_9ACTN|nr:hypothetical protein SAMN05443377_101166 [Propionibacterium cyclohexanicum]
MGCRRRDDPAAMVRYVLRQMIPLADPGATAPGRGAWVHPDPACWQRAVSRGGFARSFRTAVQTAGLPAEMFGHDDAFGE